MQRILLFAFLIATLLVFIPLKVSAIDTCYAVANDVNMLVSLDKISGKTIEIGLTGGQDIEAIAFQSGTSTLYAADADQLGAINIVTGIYTPIGAFGTGNGSEGLVLFDDVDGLTWNNATHTLFGIQRRPTMPDLLLQIDPTTGTFKPGVFNGADYVVISPTVKLEGDIDDIAIHPVTNLLYGVANDGGQGGTLVQIDKATGAIQEIGSIVDAANAVNTVDDIEGLAFFNDGRLYGSTGVARIDPGDIDQLYEIDLVTAKATIVGKFPSDYADYEALACLTATIADDDQDGLVNIGEDINNDGNLANDNTDGDLLSNYLDMDDDNDTILTSNEDPNGNGNPRDDDKDKDGHPNYLDTDDDNDGVLTEGEDANGDGDARNDDADQDTIPDYLESKTIDTDDDGLVDQVDADDDNDGVSTAEEDPNVNGNRLDDDTDGDKVLDYLDADDDNDTIPSRLEDVNGDGSPIDDHNDADGTPNFLDPDDDNDGIPTAQEDANKDGNHFNDDSDFDGVADWLDAEAAKVTLLPIMRQ